jgi:hypothetical protein
MNWKVCKCWRFFLWIFQNKLCLFQACKGAAKLMYTATQAFGCKAYQNAQKKACRCVGMSHQDLWAAKLSRWTFSSAAISVTYFELVSSWHVPRVELLLTPISKLFSVDFNFFNRLILLCVANFFKWFFFFYWNSVRHNILMTFICKINWVHLAF